MIRFLDIVASALGLILLSPVFLIVAIWIKLDDRKGPVFYRQNRVGKNGVDFGLYKFRSMFVGSDKKGLITIGGRDPRITRSGYYIRKYKLDELPQLINVLKGDMSIVGPRPEVRKYVDMYTAEQRHVLDVRPGITDYASIEYLDENALLALSSDPDKTYVEEVMPAKIKLNMRFINKPTLSNYLNIILITFLGISVSKLVNWYFTKKALSFWQVVAIDLFVALIAYIGAYAIVEGTSDLHHHFWIIAATLMLCCLPVYLVTGKYLHTFDIKLRYTNNRDLQKVAASILIGTICNLILKSFIPYDKWLWPISVVVILLGAALSALLMIMVRIISRGIYESKLTEVNLPRAVLYGTPENMEFIAQILQNQSEHRFDIYAFMTNESTNSKYRVWGKKTYIKNANVVKELVKHDVTYVICGPSMSESIRKDKVFLDQLMGAGIKVLISLQLSNLNSNGAKDSKLNFRKIEIEDLLARDQLDVDLVAIGKQLERKSILITGAGGNIGLEIVKQIAEFKPRMMLLVDVAETPLHNIMMMMQKKWPDQDYLPFVTSITSERLMENIFMNYRPDYVFHAASYNRVPVVEISPAYAIQNNCMGTRILADLSVKYGVKKFVLISTDKAVKPNNVMGCSKRICEIYCQSLNNWRGNFNGNGNEDVNGNKTQFVIARIGNILGNHSSVIHIFREQIKNGGPVTVTDPYIARYFILTQEACKLILQAGAMGHGGEIYVFDMGDPIRVADVAQRMIDMSGAKNVKIEYKGLRPGEKIYEDVISEEEELIPTDYRMIKIVKGKEYNFEEVRQNEQELEELSFDYDDMAVLGKMKEIVPEYLTCNLNVIWNGNDVESGNGN